MKGDARAEARTARSTASGPSATISSGFAATSVAALSVSDPPLVA